MYASFFPAITIARFRPSKTSSLAPVSLENRYTDKAARMRGGTERYVKEPLKQGPSKVDRLMKQCQIKAAVA